MKASEILKAHRTFLKFFPVISYLNNTFQELYLPDQDISIDESLTLWKGHLSFKQYIPLKVSKVGIKCMSCVTELQAIYGRSLYIQARTQSLTNLKKKSPVFRDLLHFK
jgi:hypothetical protein